MQTKHNEFGEGWPILALALTGVLSSATFLPLYSFGPLVGDISQSLDIPIGEIQRCMTFNFIGVAIGSQIAAWLMGRFPLRSVILVSLLAYALLWAMMASLTPSRYLLFAFYFLLPILGCGTLIVTWSKLICDRFIQRRGIALAILLSGSGIVSTCAPLILAVAATGERNWQDGFLTLSLIPAITLVICFFALPRDSVYGANTSVGHHGSSDIGENGLEGKSFQDTLADRRFWTMLLALNLVVFVVIAMITNIVPILVSREIPDTQATTIFSSFGIALIIGRLVGGALLDRFWGPAIAFVALSLPAVGCQLLLHAPPSVAHMTLAVALVGVAAGVEYDIMAYLASRYFGLRAYGRVFGAISGTVAVGAGISPLIFGAIVDMGEGYHLLLTICTIATSVGALLFLTLGSYPTFTPSGATAAEGQARHRK